MINFSKKCDLRKSLKKNLYEEDTKTYTTAVVASV